MSDDVANLKEQLKQVKEDMARQKSEYVQKIKDMEKRFEEDSAMNANVDADDMQDAAEFEAQCDMLELSLSDKIEKLTAANNTIASLKEEAAAKDEAYSSLQAEMAAQASLLAEQKAKVEEAARELEANTQLTRQYKASLDKIRAQQETRIAELKRSHEHEMHQLQERHNEEQQKWAAELRAATDRFTQQRDLLHSQIGKLQTELASRVTQITELEKRIEYLENADHVAEMLAANRKYKAALGIIEQLKGQIELLNCRIAETEKLLTIEKRKLAATQQQLAVAEQSTQDAIASAAAAHNNANHQGDTNGGGSALASFVGQTLQTPRAGSRRGLSGGLSAVNSPSQIRSSGGQRIRVKPIDSPDEQSLDQLRTVHVQSGALPDATGREGGTGVFRVHADICTALWRVLIMLFLFAMRSALQDSTPLQALTTTRAEVSFVQNLELRLQKSRTDNTRLVEEVQKLKKQIVTIEAGKASAIAAAAAEAEANALCATCGRNAEEAERFEREQVCPPLAVILLQNVMSRFKPPCCCQEEQRRQAEAAAARAAREAAEEAARRFQEDNDMFGGACVRRAGFVCCLLFCDTVFCSW